MESVIYVEDYIFEILFNLDVYVIMSAKNEKKSVFEKNIPVEAQDDGSFLQGNIAEAYYKIGWQSSKNEKTGKYEVQPEKPATFLISLGKGRSIALSMAALFDIVDIAVNNMDVLQYLIDDERKKLNKDRTLKDLLNK